jgi:hypothetical protein
MPEMKDLIEVFRADPSCSTHHLSDLCRSAHALANCPETLKAEFRILEQELHCLDAMG